MSTMSFACGTVLYETHYCRAMTEYWLISAPGEKTCQQTFDRLNQVVFKQKHAFSRTLETQDNLTQATSKNQLSTNWKFHIPDLKVSLWILARPSLVNPPKFWNEMKSWSGRDPRSAGWPFWRLGQAWCFRRASHQVYQISNCNF